jgi:hypothetical protein
MAAQDIIEVIMRVLLVLAVTVIAAVAETPTVKMLSDFQIGDRFEVRITGPANQPVSVRTIRNGRTDWGPIIGWTDLAGRWSTGGLFEKSDVGGWNEVWTVGGKVANPSVQFSVSAPCLKEGRVFLQQIGIQTILTCETAQGEQTFPSASLTFRTPDGRLITPNETSMTREQYKAGIMSDLIGSREADIKLGLLGDEAGVLLTNTIGPNALTENEARNVLSIIRDAFATPSRIPQTEKDPSSTLLFLQSLANSADSESFKQQIMDTMANLRAQGQ